MKRVHAFGVALAVGSLAMAQTRLKLDSPADKDAVPPGKSAPAGKTAPGKAAPGKTAPGKDAAKAAETPKIEGQEIARGGGGYLGLQIVNGTFKLSFYDAKKKAVAPDVARAMFRWDAKSKSGKEFVLLTPGEDGKSLAASKAIRPPYAFKLFITLLKDAAAGEDAPGESFVVDFRQ